MRIFLVLLLAASVVFSQGISVPFNLNGGGANATGSIDTATNMLTATVTLPGGGTFKAGPVKPFHVGPGGIWWKCKGTCESGEYTVMIGAAPGGALCGYWYSSGSPSSATKMQ